MSSRFFAICLIVCVFFTRFIRLDWGDGHFFHPDENNMASSLSQLSTTNLNPHFYAYGQFPLYLGYVSLRAFNLDNTFSNSIIVLRFWSAVFSLISVYVFFLISQKILSRNLSLISTLLYIFSPGLIQISHFGTTESLLVLVFLLIILTSLSLLSSPTIKIIVVSSFVFGIGLATKISSVFFATPVAIVLIIELIQSKNIARFLRLSLIFFFIALVIGISFSPYNLIDSDSFLSSMKYEAGVATGSLPVFYTRQFVNTTPYLFQFIKVFPFTSGLSQFILGLIGLFFIARSQKKQEMSIIIISSLIYLTYFGSLYVKWTRFMSPLFFLFPLLSAITLSKIRVKSLRLGLVLLSVLPGIIFLRIYLKPDVRVSATQWIERNVDKNSSFLSESGNVVNLPLNGGYLVNNFDFYNDLNPSLLAQDIFRADYILIPSRRVFKN